MQLLEQIKSIDFPAPLPPTLLTVEQRFDAPHLTDISGAVQSSLEDGELLGQIKPGDSIAVGVGSRGIANLPLIVRTVIEHLKSLNAQPFVFPAMGSHGGATSAGQLTMLAELGITSETVGVDIRPTMEVIQVAQIPDGPALFQDVISVAADHTLLINRIKPHTDFRAGIESGLAKMAVIGLGKQRGAEAMHTWGAEGFKRFLPLAARLYESRSNLLGGLAILENANDETAEIGALPASEIGEVREAKLQERAKALMPGLPFPEIDALVIRQIGKDISGTGMDTNIVGRLMISRQPENFGEIDIAVIAVLDLTDRTHGNGAGIGLANVTTARVAQKIDWNATYTNALTTGIFGMQRVSLPITMSNDLRAVQIAVRGCGQPNELARLVFVQDTLTLDRLWVSPNLRADVDSHPRLSIVEEAPLEFTPTGVMTSPWRLS